MSKISFPGRISYESCIFSVLSGVLLFLGWMYVEGIYLLHMDIKNFMVMIWKYSDDDDWVKHPGMIDNLSLGYLQDHQKHRPKGSVLSSVKSPCSSEAEASQRNWLTSVQCSLNKAECIVLCAQLKGLAGEIPVFLGFALTISFRIL